MRVTAERSRWMRNLHREGKSIKEIAEITEVSRPTVYHHLEKKDFNEPVPPPAVSDDEKPDGASQKDSILDPYKPFIIEWLEADKEEPYKQRHTNKRIFTRLKKEHGYEGSRATVDNYVRKLRTKMGVFKKKSDAEGYIPLDHPPGTAQADFGKARFVENGVSHSGSYLALDFPYSNQAFIQLKYGENEECLLEGLQDIFNYLGGVPTEIWFDNASCITRTDAKTRIRSWTSEKFINFSLHYDFGYKFMNCGKGHEKGSVEKAVGTYRNNLLVPVPKFGTIDNYNKELLVECENYTAEKAHYAKGVLISQLFEKDRAALLPLPTSPFDTAQNRKVRTNKCGIFTLEDGLHRYSSAPNFSECELNVRITSSTVEVMDSKRNNIVTHLRLYGGKDERMERYDYVPYLKYMARKPNTFRNTPVREMMPVFLCSFLDNLSNTDRGKALQALWDLTQEKGLEDAVDELAAALQDGCIEDLVPSIGGSAGESGRKDAGTWVPDVPAIPQGTESLKQGLEEMDAILKGVYE